MSLKLDCTSELPGGFAKTEVSRSHTDFLYGWDISSKFPDYANAAGPVLWKLSEDIISDFVPAFLAIHFTCQIKSERKRESAGKKIS